MKYKIHGTVLQAVTIELTEGESIYSEAGNMSWMSDNIKMETSSHGLVEGIKRRFSGETIFLNTFTCTKDKGIVNFASEFPGKVLPIELSKHKELILQKDAFMCAEPTVYIKMHFRKRLGAGFFGGEGFILQKLSGNGTAFVEIDGEIIEYNLKKDQLLKVGTGHVAMFEPSVDFDIEFIKGAKNIFFGGEGLFLSTLKGPGKIWLQTMPLVNLARRLSKHIIPRNQRGSRLGLISDIGRGI